MYDEKEPYQWKAYNNQPYRNQLYHQAPPAAQPFDSSRPPKKKGRILKKAALITAGSVWFGTVAGGVMARIHIAAPRYLGPAAASSVPEDKRVENRTFTDGGERTEPGVQPMSNIENAPMSDVSDIVEAAMPSVVAITSTTVYQSGNYGYGWFFGGGVPQTYEVPNSGSGIIIGENDKELLIVTNNHVVEDASSLRVAFIDDQVVDAAIKGTDSESDLAMIAIPLEVITADTRSRIRVAKLGSSDELKVGQGVVAIGNALGYGQSVTVGYVSALNREVQVSNTATRTLLQTDAAINPGNSGGALLNMRGEVIGINVAKYSSTEVEGMGYAIPVSKVDEILNQLMNRRTRKSVAEEKRGYLGIQGISVDDNTSRSFGMPKGAYVYKILEDGAAAGSGLKEKDIITKVDAQTVKDMTQLQEIISGYEKGEQIELTVQRQEGGQYAEQTVTITLKAMPQEKAQNGRKSQAP